MRSQRSSCSCILPSDVANAQFPLSNGKQSPWICHSGWPPEQSCKSHEYASWPNARNALHTSCDSSQAINTLMLTPSKSHSFLFHFALRSFSTNPTANSASPIFMISSSAACQLRKCATVVRPHLTAQPVRVRDRKTGRPSTVSLVMVCLSFVFRLSAAAAARPAGSRRISTCRI